MIIALQTLIFFRESIFSVIDRLLRPYYKHFSLAFERRSKSDDEGSEDQVFAEYDVEKGVVFYPSMYVQRYAAVSDCLVDERWCGKLEKVVDLGYHDMSFIKYLKELSGIKTILGVDLENIPLRCSSDLLGGDDYIPKRENPLQVTLYQGNAADPDYRLIGCDAVVAIEMIEHMLPHDLDRLVHTIFAFIKPWVVIITTPNGDFNLLFKKLESNGLRRLDHYFEWSREQFHDWCSNIVVRYPQYTVSCRGIGPGPTGTEHYGCCSQLALFCSKDYQKQQDLDLNSLAMVAKPPKTTNVCDIIGNLDSAVALTESNNMLNSHNTIESYTELVHSDKLSSVTIVLTPTFSLESLEYRDRTAQCNLDSELGKNFIMFDDEPYCSVLVPQRKINNRVYVMEDVNCRLNCTTLQVKKFSKTTQDMLAKNKADSFAHTRDVVDNINHLTEMLNLNKGIKEKGKGDHVWQNINWGDNAPYWNQYYKTVREYRYPFEAKTEECQILDLVSDEINTLIDMQCEDDISKVEIPMDHLMRVVAHITDDKERVRDLLEWNGYEIADGVVIYSRPVVDASIGSQEDWGDDAFSDRDNVVHSSSISDGSPVIPDYLGRSLYRALELKVRKLRSTLTADEDISVELDHVVKRLMKLALKTTWRRQSPPSKKWLQHKMLDLLTLSERAIENKKKRYVEAYPLKAIYEDQNTTTEELVFNRIQEDIIANEIVKKYRYLVTSPDNKQASEDEDIPYNYDQSVSHDNSEDFFKETLSSELNFEEVIPALLGIESALEHLLTSRTAFSKNDTPLERTLAWVEEDVNAGRIYEQSSHGSSGDTDQGVNNRIRFKNKRKHREHKKSVEKEAVLDVNKKQKKSTNYTCDKRMLRNVKKCKGKTSKARPTKRKSSYNVLMKKFCKKMSCDSIGNNAEGFTRNQSDNILQKLASKSISETFIPEKNIENIIEKLNIDEQDLNKKEQTYISRTEESFLIDIVTEEKEETIALRRTIGTDADDEFGLLEQETILGSLMNVMKADSFYNTHETETEHLQIYIYDYNEPSTSKGVRHVSMEVQCGPDTTMNYAMLSATTSLTQIFNTDIKIGDSSTDIQLMKKSADFDIPIDECANQIFKTVSSKTKSAGIRIKDSNISLEETVINGLITQEAFQHREMDNAQDLISLTSLNSATDTRLLKPVLSQLKIEDLGSELCNSVDSFRKSLTSVANISKKTTDIQIPSEVNKDVGLEARGRKLSSKYVRPKLSCGGVHIHSYKDRQISEDVMYQGEWQRYRLNPSKRRAYNFVIPKKINEVTDKKAKVVTKEKIIVNKEVKTIRKPIRIVNLNHLKDEKSKPNETTAPNFVAKKSKNTRNRTKVSFKLASSVLSKSNTLACVTNKPSMTLCIKKDDKPQRYIKKSYIPLYLKRKVATKKKNETLIHRTDSTKTVIEVTKERPIGLTNEVIESKDKANDKLLETLDVNLVPIGNISYIVYHNEIDKTPVADSETSSLFNSTVVIDSSRRSPSPQSLNSSAYSPPHSVDTVKKQSMPKMTRDRFSGSFNKSNLNPNKSSPVHSKLFTKTTKSGKKPQEKVLNNKENDPNNSDRNKEIEKYTKRAFRDKNFCRTHATLELSPQSAHNNLSKRRPQANVKIPTISCSSEKQSSPTLRPSIFKRTSPKFRSLLSENNSEKLSIDSNAPSVPTTSFKQVQNVQTLKSEKNEDVIVNIVENSVLSEWMNSSNKNVIDNHTSNILVAMKNLVEERLDFLDSSSENLEVDSKTVVLSKDQLKSVPVSASTSFHDGICFNDSFETEIEGNISVIEGDIHDKEIMNDTILETIPSASYSDLNLTDITLLSAKSLISASRLSEYFLAESALNATKGSHHSGPNVPCSGSVQDIFERKRLLSTQNFSGPIGALAVQAFSGFSVNAEPTTGDRPDRINIIDSETGSFGLAYNRHTTSEEVFISGRSSESYESCLIEEDAVVPYWLFQIISQQQSLDEEQEPLLPMPIPLGDPMLDVNGNAIEGMGAGTGAGDGRGIHSDHSNDSSGHGTSLSSSVTFSGSEPQSEAISSDPTAPSTTREAITSSLDIVAPPLPLESPDKSFMTAEDLESSGARDVNSWVRDRSPGLRLRTTSDGDADVSSIDTEVLDSSDN